MMDISRLNEIVPAFKIVDGEEEVKCFDSFARLYEWCHQNDTATLGAIMADVFITFHFGECPMKYDRKTGELYMLGWQKVERKPDKKEN